MAGVLLLMVVTVLYAAYNVLVKISGSHVPDSASTTIVATLCIQLAALATSVVFLGALAARGGQSFALTPSAYTWAALAGLCIGGAEIGYLYLFSGIGIGKPMAATIVIPTVVSGTVVLAIMAAGVFLKEPIGWHQLMGAGLIVCGVVFLFLGERPQP
jgi:drug/metabolite transporter (DMT)-like permease